MKNLKPIKLSKTKRSIVALFIIGSLFSCSSDSGDENQSPENEVDLTVISGRYVGLWSWEPGTGPISMIVTPENEEGLYRIEYWESNNFLPKNNSDGVTPEARGTLQINGTTATIALVYITDSPSCTGDFTGTGTRTADGVLDLNMDIVDCNADATASWNLTKTKEL